MARYLVCTWTVSAKPISKLRVLAAVLYLLRLILQLKMVGAGSQRRVMPKKALRIWIALLI
jgi:hypothetical protein